ncbi:cuticle protein 6-like [Ctenocephalides felis]|uniref:cuticle protein 6-like n=1 Tax=Ctenocephalides felis TaxID=7515 RepID=UPI000E6E1B45|nr:cuticle protein 6-like [Ctenocephalides felis]
MSFVSILCFVAVAFSAVSARPGILFQQPYVASPYVATPYVAGGHVSTQYHSQDDFGQYAYGYNNGFDSKTEHKTLDGVTRGSYSYVDAEGKLQSVHYTADAVNGFRVAATNLPEDSGSAPSAEGYVAPISGDVPTPVEETPEVAEARSAHLKAVEEAKVRNALAPVPVEAPLVRYVSPYVAPTFNYVTPYVTPYSTYVHGVPTPVFRHYAPETVQYVAKVGTY